MYKKTHIRKSVLSKCWKFQKATRISIKNARGNADFTYLLQWYFPTTSIADN